MFKKIKEAFILAFETCKKMLKEDKKLLVTISLTTLIAFLYVGLTTALLTSITRPVENTFTIGYINLELNETTGSSYNLVPGKVVSKDPKVTVKSGSEDCWLFVKITKTQGFDDYLTYELEDGWTHLGGFEGVYYRTVVEVQTDVQFNILKNNQITVRDDLTEEKMSAISVMPNMSFKAYAVQSDSDTTAGGAWSLILGEGE